MKTIFGETEVEEYKLTDEDWENIEKLSNDKYRTWHGIMVETLNITLNAREKFEKGFVQIKFDVKRGKIEHAKIFGVFLWCRRCH